MIKLKTILLTGASGVIGSALLQRLGHHRVIALVHHSSVLAEEVRGDLTEPRLGLDDVTYQRLRSIVDTVVHCGATISLRDGARVTQELNVRGTGRVTEFAASAGADLLYVSTSFIARNRLARVEDARSNPRSGAVPHHYLDSKQAAEELVRSSGVPYAIARPSLVIGDSDTGFMPSFQGLHSIIGALLRGALPLFPVEKDARIDIIPRDTVADAIAAMVDHGLAGQEQWLTSGTAAPTAHDFVRTCLRRASAWGIPMPTPRIVGPDAIDRLIRPVFISSLAEAERRRFDDLLALASLFDTSSPFPSTLEEIPGGPAPLSATELRDALSNSIDHLAHRKGLIRAGKEEPAQ
ncbi:SDR family oxidoreductase [Kitasatospora purpeofusca]|uniref:SDR family oxidoreductase n=1 Tax=Kitasatospora purpeofusca TaxID=67352 RepID=UPI002254C554|nr:SDR family oxidoreductase [Kitasatospora purpeofusca]MCX4690683.1 SDR family oxidoreductase [Kitasatospora purpeofusca]